MLSGSKQKDTFTSQKLQYIESLVYVVGFTIDYTWKMKTKQEKKNQTRGHSSTKPLCSCKDISNVTWRAPLVTLVIRKTKENGRFR